MDREELLAIIPDLADDTVTVSEEVRAEAEAALLLYPDMQQELEIARQVRIMLATLRAERPELRVPAGFETRLLARIRQQRGSLEVLDLSCTALSAWLIEFINLVGGLIVPIQPVRTTRIA